MQRLHLLRATAAALTIAVITGTQATALAAKPNQGPATLPTGSPYITGQIGTDVSWPNCSASNPKSKFGIVGVTGGTVYSQNSCLGKEASWYSNPSLYANTGWYDQSSHVNPNFPRVCVSGDQNCLAYNYGYNAGLDALSYSASAGVSSKTWWLDVESGNTWNADTAQNQNSLQGERDALVDSGATTVGVYSTTAQWDGITGTWKNGWPNWGATTWRTAKQAKTYCTGHEFTGGPTYLIQFAGAIDQDYAC